MAESTGWVLVAAGIAGANEAIFAPVVQHKPLWVDFNWRLVPATVVAAFMLAGLEKASPPLGKGLAMLAVLAVLSRPMGKAPSPLDNVATMLGLKK